MVDEMELDQSRKASFDLTERKTTFLGDLMNREST